ncbi:MAG: thiamine-phosphate kinase [Clostridia bacterium]|nr:MAG: thiamine-phosphate kinase [Clostridia bacterium]
MDLRHVGEWGLIKRFTRGSVVVPERVIAGIGDDAAVLPGPEPGEVLLATTDMLVETVHFRREWSTPEDVGYKAMAVNLSDIAAMGGRPESALLSLAVPKRLEIAWVESFSAGLRSCAARFGVNIVGGDTVASPNEVITISITVLGSVLRDRCLYRHGARPGDVLMVTGNLGGAAAGLALLQHPEMEVDAASPLLRRHRRPEPRVEAGKLLSALGGVTCADDISDGLVSEMYQISEAGQVGLEIYVEKIPMAPGVNEVAAFLGYDPLELALYGGEDYELLFTVAPGAVAKVARTLREAGIEVTPIGLVLPSGEGISSLRGLKRSPLPPGGYEHFRSN